jgi:hypothetical protein
MEPVLCTHNSVAELLDPTGERGSASSLSGNHSAVFCGKRRRAEAVLH